MTTRSVPPALAQTVAEWSEWSTRVRVAVRCPSMLMEARWVVESEIAGMDAAANRFRPDSEVCQLAGASGRATRVSPLLAEAVAVALRVAEATDGAVDPTLGRALVAAGYDADISVLAGRSVPGKGVRPLAPTKTHERAVSVVSKGSWQDVHLVGDILTLPSGVLLDLGATGKALTIDRAALRAAAVLGGQVLVAIGGDLRVAGPPDSQPWLVEISEAPDDPGQAWITVQDGAVATSTTTSRTWQTAHGAAHHILDPVTARPVDPWWRTATVCAASCVDANAASTAALVKGPAAAGWLAGLELPGRLVGRNGTVEIVAGWPEPRAA